MTNRQKPKRWEDKVKYFWEYWTPKFQKLVKGFSWASISPFDKAFLKSLTSNGQDIKPTLLKIFICNWLGVVLIFRLKQELSSVINERFVLICLAPLSQKPSNFKFKLFSNFSETNLLNLVSIKVFTSFVLMIWGQSPQQPK